MPPISACLRRISRRSAALAATTAAGLALAACGSSGSSTSSSSASPGGGGKTLNIAYLSFAVENSYDAPMLAAAQAVASDSHATMKVFDANNSPQTQYAPQVAGLSANVAFVPTEIGTKLGTLVVQACKANSLNLCKVGYLYDIKASALDVAIYGAFGKAIAADPAVKIVAQGQSFFSPTTGLTAVQNMLTANRGLNLIVGFDQGIEGGAQAVQSAHLTGKVILVGYGASAAALAGVASGAWYADVAQAPASEGRLAVQALVSALRTGKSSGGIDPVAQLPDTLGGILLLAVGTDAWSRPRTA